MLGDKISFVLPLSLNESSFGNKYVYWRSDTSEVNFLRLERFLISFLRCFRQSDLGSFLIVCPVQDVTRASAILTQVTSDARYSVIEEERYLLKQLPGSAGFPLGVSDGEFSRR
ncbi:DUF6492 family protein [Granulicella aggregans]|uniref:DUF6492 family protein n=1 Tax=Granulicella aggregans TaxID=474949 RepID=UPI003D7C24D6